ncbi:hypothetical protein KKG52_01170, partial [Patescibacteria group bacterium]|nr:hypothetical protein [Patescibacteria group bacterium]
YTTNHPEISMTSILPGYDYWNNSLKAIPVNMYSFAEIMAMALKLENSNNLLDISSVKYVFIPIRDLVNDQDFFVFFGKSRQYYIDQLNKISYLKKIDIGTKEIVVYENKDFRPHIYATAEKETIYKDLRPTIYDVKYKFVNPTEYKVSLKNVKTPFYLNFSESYHPQWNVYLGDFKWYSVLLNKQKAISNKNHFKNDAGLNSYVLDPKSICKQSACVQNKDGSHNINMTLYFAPQSYMYFGGIISLTTLFGVLSYLGYIGFSKLKK